MKKISFDFKIEKPKLPDHEFEFWVNETSKLIGRSYIQTFKLVQDWPLSKIRDRHIQATKHNGNIKPSIKWWADRKRDKHQ